MSAHDPVADLIVAVPVFAPAGDTARGRVSATTTPPGATRPDRVVVDFGWHSDSAELDLEITTRAWPGPHPIPSQRLRAFCAERAFMQRLTHQVPARPDPAPDVQWSALDLDVDGRTTAFTVSCSADAWVAAAALHDGWLLRLFAPAAPHALALRRITDPADLHPLLGRS
ncbi:hypothetical protein [Nocardiopsis ansamitocini]|uniref:Uncharacterized protein n=1 Tax=Nocardiopsis ansamitocini TaxID=1670832 RepID=A0A9W6UJ81_9ACTN|nr:hypothetical protein [Nocardiopsis ansamitocini]GLU48228.1 hypothetical protein Nans01_25790 [Nocardiopsis ansamitocini]